MTDAGAVLNAYRHMLAAGWSRSVARSVAQALRFHLQWRR